MVDFQEKGVMFIFRLQEMIFGSPATRSLLKIKGNLATTWRQGLGLRSRVLELVTQNRSKF